MINCRAKSSRYLEIRFYLRIVKNLKTNNQQIFYIKYQKEKFVNLICEFSRLHLQELLFQKRCGNLHCPPPPPQSFKLHFRHFVAKLSSGFRWLLCGFWSGLQSLRSFATRPFNAACFPHFFFACVFILWPSQFVLQIFLSRLNKFA